jgi:hypothetical protein
MFKEDDLKLSKRRKLFLWMLLLKRRINKVLLIVNIVINAFIIISLLFNFNVGIVFFLLNTYFMVILYLKYRRENINERKRLVD